MVNFYESVLQHPNYYRQFNCNNSLITVFNCPLEARLVKTRFAALWTHYNYLFYVVGGRKVWHTADGSYHFGKGDCVFVRKGAFVLEQIVDAGFCVVLFFIPDDFIRQTMQGKLPQPLKARQNHRQLLELESSDSLAAFFLSMSSYFAASKDPDQSLLELKFKELILTIAGNPRNGELRAYFCSLQHEPRSRNLERMMMENFCYNLTIADFAKMCNRSVSAFKRDFQRLFHTTPGKWLLEKRLLNAKSRLSGNTGQSISETAFESGFETLAHFSRCFRKRFGMTPSSVRNRERHLNDRTV